MYKYLSLVGASLLFACYQSNDPGLETSMKNTVDSGVDDVDEADQRDRSRVLGKRLDMLSNEEARIVCQQTQERSDPCMTFGLSKESITECRDYVRDCEEDTNSGGLFGSCNGFGFGEPGSCAAKGEQYFDCVEAFEAIRTCDNAGKVLIAPKPCFEVIQDCEAVSQSFGRAPQAIGECSETGDARGSLEHDKDIIGAERCFPKPARMVVLGDSLSKCFSYVAPIDDCACSWKNVAGYIRDNYAADLVVEGCYPDEATIRGNIHDVAEDARTVMGGPGHVLVYISTIAWDLLDFDLERDVFEEALQNWLADWQRLFDYFTDETVFPDGVTFMLNTIFSPTDDCPQSDKDTYFPTLSADAERLVQRANELVILQPARERDDTVAVDIYPDWLGHGHNFDVSTCPHYSADKDSWMSDQTHPNNKGYLHMANKWKRAVDRIYGENCR